MLLNAPAASWKCPSFFRFYSKSKSYIFKYSHMSKKCIVLEYKSNISIFNIFFSYINIIK